MITPSRRRSSTLSWHRSRRRQPLFSNEVGTYRSMTTTTTTATTSTSTESSSASSSTILMDDRQQQKKVLATQYWMKHIVIGEKLCPFAAPLLKQTNGSSSNGALQTNSSKQNQKIRIVPTNASSADEAVAVVTQQLHELQLPMVMVEVGLEGNNTSDDDDDTKDDSSNHGGQQPQHETTLIVFDGDFLTTSSSSYRDFVLLSWRIQEECIVAMGYHGHVQIVLFHPWATHQTYNDDNNDDDTNADNPADYTIRSPYPTIHLLREQDVLKAVQGGYYPHLDYLPMRNQQKMIEQGLQACRQRLQACHEFAITAAAATEAEGEGIER